MEKTTESRYINLMTDYGFKKVFGEKDIMMAFLTDLLQPASPIQEIKFLDKESTGTSEFDRGVIYDLFCTTEDGAHFIVEMQNRSQSYFNDRILFYLSRSFSNQEKKGDTGWDFELTPVYGIFFLNFHLRGFEPQRKRTVQLKVEETGEVFSSKFKAFTLELPDYREMSESDCKTKLDYWLYNISNLETMTTAVPFQNHQPIFTKVGTIAELVHMTPEELQKYNISINSYRSNLSVIKNERAEGRAEGEAIGLKKGLAEGESIGILKGRQESRISIALNMKSMGLDTEFIAHATGMTIDEINNLFNE